MVKKSSDTGFSPLQNDDSAEKIARYSSFFGRTRYCIYIHDFQGNFLDANDAALELLGYERGDIPGLNFASLIDENQIPMALEAMRENMEIGRAHV